MKIKVYDNGGKTWDRYTVSIDEDVYSMSANATSPDGFNQYWGELKDFDKPMSRFGKRLYIDEGQVPEEVCKAIAQRAQLTD